MAGRSADECAQLTQRVAEHHGEVAGPGPGHRVTGLARSAEAADRVAALGAEVRRGDLADTDGLAAAARAADGVVHLGYHHDFSQMAEAAALDRAALEALGAELEGKPLLFATGVVGVHTEDDQPDPALHPRSGNALAALAQVARERGVSAYVGAGTNLWPAVHRSTPGGSSGSRWTRRRPAPPCTRWPSPASRPA